MSEQSYFFYLPPGILKVEQIQTLLFNPNPDIQFTGGTIEVNGVSNQLKEPTTSRGLWFWRVYDYPMLSTLNCSKLSIDLNGYQKFEYDLDELTFISQTEEKIRKENLSNSFIFEFKAGFFVKNGDATKKTISIDKLNILHYQKRMAYEKACEQNQTNTQRFEALCSEGFNEFFDQFTQFNEKRSRNRIITYEKKVKELEDYPVSPFLDPDAKINDEVREKKAESTEKCLLDNVPPKPDFVPNNIDFTPSQADIKQFLADLNPLFQLEEDKQLFCNIKIDDPDIQSQKMFCFNLGHFLVLFSAFTGISFDYRISMFEGAWKIEDRFTGLEIKKDTITKANPIDNPYRNALISCLIKLCTELKIPKSSSVAKMIGDLQKYYTQL
ncbi:hypothetical protein TVAG_116910 [Trichomonas vaginalis G3]|uniref:Uncharacterized protein n=1 Tax=Trichomonas vaginalis (strain ATCC PRA-98 / G3) TaxID=412133 RepID=A2FD66_TRIV3|nr:hypothetical protein TVAGG3_1005160 [Trichomonas vaginalis G3]EAX97173.1 hypothetical protein TVAG_116910 [Trichomonas vaginalis G3]KAI5491082.1 hypothetical protein TVAGG3_1005160 [Trichomonas vaginalis G3]|eukprot:XP_001310103.1 hypothetical protein [Trichomonas vaginalis G3]